MKLRSGNSTENGNISSRGNTRKRYKVDGEGERATKDDRKKGRLKSRSQNDTPHIHERIIARSTQTNGYTSNSQSLVNLSGHRNRSSDDKLVPHRQSVVLILKLGAWMLISMYFLIPAFIKLNPWIMAEMAFLHRVRWPPFLNLTDTSRLGLNSTISFMIKSEEGHSIGTWHMLPYGLGDYNGLSTQEEFRAYLSKGYPIVMYSHGQAGTRAAWHRMALYKKFADAGFHVIAYDYRGYGDSGGYPTEAGMVSDGYTVFNWIRKYSANSPIYLWGHSMGTGVTTKLSQRLCKEGSPPGSVILEAPFTNILEAAAHYPLTIPFTYMPWYAWVFVESIKHNNISFANDESIHDISVPILVVHAKDDGMVSYRMGRKLFEIGKQSKRNIQMFSFDSVHGYGHKHIHKAPELMSIFRDFTSGRDVNNS